MSEWFRSTFVRLWRRLRPFAPSQLWRHRRSGSERKARPGSEPSWGKAAETNGTLRKVLLSLENINRKPLDNINRKPCCLLGFHHCLIVIISAAKCSLKCRDDMESH